MSTQNMFSLRNKYNVNFLVGQVDFDDWPWTSNKI